MTTNRESGKPKPSRVWISVIDEHGTYQGDSKGLPVLYSTPKEAEAAGGRANLAYLVPDLKGVRYWCILCPEQFYTEDEAVAHFRSDGHGFSSNIHHGFLKRDGHL